MKILIVQKKCFDAVNSYFAVLMQYLLQYNLAVKANAVAKLTYLQMLGYDISWAGFNIIEVIMSVKRSTNTYIILCPFIRYT